MKNSFIGSTVVMVTGVISTLGQILHWPSISDDNFLGGMTALLGAMAYRSAKQRRLGLKQDTFRRRLIERALLMLVFLPIPIAAAVPDGIIHHPWLSVLIPAWTLIAFLIVRYKRIEPAVPSLK